jgi:hypothetical protein
MTLDIMQTLADLSLPVVTPHIPVWAKLLLDICGTSSLDVNVRSTFLCGMLSLHKRRISRAKLIPDVMQCGLALAVEYFEDEQFEASQMTPQKIALG